MTTTVYTAENWPIAAAMLPFGSVDSHGGPIHDADPEEWAKHLRVVARGGFTEVDPTDTWVRVESWNDPVGPSHWIHSSVSSCSKSSAIS